MRASAGWRLVVYWLDVFRDDKGGRGGVECGVVCRVGRILGGCAWWIKDEGMICNELM